MPTRRERARRVVLVKEVAVFRDRFLAEAEEVTTEFTVASKVERVCDECAIARPVVGVRVACEVRDVVIVRSNDRAAVVDLRAKNDFASHEEIAESLW